MSETYYGAFYGFHTAPFHVTPDASLLFPTATYLAASGAIEYGITAGKGFIVVSGQVGVGKTTVLRACLERLDPAKTKIIYLFNPALTTAELYATILDELDPNLRISMSPGDTLRTLLRCLLEAHQAGIQVVLAVDEAQNMPEQTLESLRILSNLETTRTKLLQIILVGQPELDDLLNKHSLRQLAQRVAVRAHIKRLTFRQSCRYIQHRTRCAGRSRSLFTAPAQWYIAIAARGIPRTINICCDNALINGYGHSAQRISLGIAREACGSLEYRWPLRRAATLTGALIVLLCGVLYGHALRDRFFGVPAPSPSASLEEPAPRVQIAASPTDRRAVKAPAADTAADKSANAPETAKSRLRWVVRKGDSVYKACLETYGSCYDRTLRAVLADNPQFGSGALIHEGDILTMPESISTLPAKKPH
jgi:general secretion pathway protein A